MHGKKVDINNSPLSREVVPLIASKHLAGIL
jgi:hypothetical protein